MNEKYGDIDGAGSVQDEHCGSYNNNRDRIKNTDSNERTSRTLLRYSTVNEYNCRICRV